ARLTTFTSLRMTPVCALFYQLLTQDLKVHRSGPILIKLLFLCLPRCGLVEIAVKPKQAAEFGNRSGVVIDAEVDVPIIVPSWSGVGAANQESCALLST